MGHTETKKTVVIMGPQDKFLFTSFFKEEIQHENGNGTS